MNRNLLDCECNKLMMVSFDYTAQSFVLSKTCSFLRSCIEVVKAGLLCNLHGTFTYKLYAYYIFHGEIQKVRTYTRHFDQLSRY